MSVSAENLMWIYRHRPTDFSAVALSEDNRKLLEGYVAGGEIPHLLFFSTPGTGKTASAEIITRALDCSVLKLNASNERGIEVIRDRVAQFARTHTTTKWNVVFLDEADRLTAEAQDALRNLMEETASKTRFILTANEVRRIIPAIRSRCQNIEFHTSPPNQRARVLAGILKAEGLEFQPGQVLEFAKKFTDLRQMINTAQKSYQTKGRLEVPVQLEIGGPEILQRVQAKNWEGLRTLVADPAFDCQTALKELFYAIPDTHAQCAKWRWAVARAVHEAPVTPDPVIHFLGVCADLIQG